MTSNYYIPISQPGDDFTPCGKWGCGNHGVCDINNTCTCKDGWTGASCHIPPVGQVPAHLGDAACGNWDVFGTMTLGLPGYAPTCECKHGMKGDRCEVECTENADCGHGTCDTIMGRCVCATRCYNDADCPGTSSCDTSILQCTSGWTGVKCSHALDATCTSNDDCGVNGGFGEGGVCVDGVCVCEPDYAGMRCERELSKGAQACNVSSECAGRGDVCVSRSSATERPCHPDCNTKFTGRACAMTGEACEEDYDCQVMCREGICAVPTSPPDLPELELVDKLKMILDQLLTYNGVAQMLAEEGIEELPAWVLKALKKGRTLLNAISKSVVMRGSKVAAEGTVAKAAAVKASAMAVKSSSHAATRGAISKAMNKMAGLGSQLVGMLWFSFQALGMVLDIDDMAGFNAQVPQGGVNMYMQKIEDAINNFPELREIGVQFPREYLPKDTIEWRIATYNEVVDDRRMDLMLDYLNRLVINSNGERIVTTWKDPSRPTLDDAPKDARNSVLWDVAGKNTQVYSALVKWWWLIVVLALVAALTIGLGVGLTARKRAVTPRPSAATP